MERRELIAKNLEYISERRVMPDDFLSTLKRALSVEDGSWRTVLSTLSDLIDPTCADVSKPPKEGFWPAPHFECSECGCKHVSPDYVRYCPHCGARVVSSDGV